MSSNPEHHSIVYMAVPMKDAPAASGEAVPSAPAIFVPTAPNENEATTRSTSSAKRSLIRAALFLSMGFAFTTLAWAMMPPPHGHGKSPCQHSFLRGAPRVAEMPSDPMDHHGHGMDHHHGAMHGHNGMHGHGMMMHPDHKMMMNPYKSSKDRRWKSSFHHFHSISQSNSNSNSESSSQDVTLDGWYAGNESHDGWHASFYGMRMRSGDESSDSEDSADSEDSKFSGDSEDSTDSEDSADSEDIAASKDSAGSEDNADNEGSEESVDSEDSKHRADSEDASDSEESADGSDSSDGEDSEDLAESEDSPGSIEDADSEYGLNSVESIRDSVPISLDNLKDIIDTTPFEAVERVDLEYEDGVIPGLP